MLSTGTVIISNLWDFSAKGPTVEFLSAQSTQHKLTKEVLFLNVRKN